MIQVYYGEFTISPAPLELSFNACSHGCFYCYANMNSPQRTFGERKLADFLDAYERGEDESLVAQLLRAGYPVVVSNRCDPFAASNMVDSLPVIERLTSMGIDLAFQTKGGPGWRDVLRIIRPSVWYVTIEMPETARAKIAPNAPTIASRLDMVEQLVMAGHSVIVAINPCVPEWTPDPLPILKAARDRGADGCWVERLHLSKTQIGKLKPWERKALGPVILKRAQDKGDLAEIAHIERTRDQARDVGLEVFSVGQATPSAIFEPYGRLYKRVFPTLQDFVNRLHQDSLGGKMLSFDQYASFMCGRLPYGMLPIQSYLGATSRGIWARHKIPEVMTYRDLLRYTWIDPWTKYSLVQSPAFAYAARWDATPPAGWVQMTDEADLPYLVFNQSGRAGYYQPVERGL